MNMMPEIDDDESAATWEQIKHFAGARNKATKHPLIQEAERAQRKEPQHLDEGGVAGGDVPLMGDLTSGDSAQFAPPVSRETIAPPVPPPPALINKPGPAPAPFPGSMVPKPAPAPSIAPGTSSAAPQADYDSQASKILGGITPEVIQQLSEKLNRESRRGQIGAGIAGIGDAIASVGGIKGEHMKNAEDTLEKNREFGMRVPSEMAAAGKEKYEMGQRLQEKDPASPLSRHAQKAYGALGDKLGIDLRNASASMISDITGKSVDAFKAEMEGTVKGRELGLTQDRLDEEARNNDQERTLEREKIRAGAQEKLSGEGLFHKVTHMFDPAEEALKATAGIGAKSAGPYGAETVKNGKTYEWSAETGKYHLKQ